MVKWAGFFRHIIILVLAMINTVDIWLFKIATGLAYFFIISYCAIYFIPFGLASVWFGKRWGHKSFKKNIVIMSIMTALWIALEYLRGILFTGFVEFIRCIAHTNPVLIQIASQAASQLFLHLLFG